jgi:hypothetical protein
MCGCTSDSGDFEDCGDIAIDVAACRDRGMIKESNDVAATTDAVAIKKLRIPFAEESRINSGQAIAPRPHATFNAAIIRARAAGTTVPAITLPAVSPAPRPKPIVKRATCARPKPAHTMPEQPIAVIADP